MLLYFTLSRAKTTYKIENDMEQTQPKKPLSKLAIALYLLSALVFAAPFAMLYMQLSSHK